MIDDIQVNFVCSPSLMSVCNSMPPPPHTPATLSYYSGQSQLTTLHISSFSKHQILTGVVPSVEGFAECHYSAGLMVGRRRRRRPPINQCCDNVYSCYRGAVIDYHVRWTRGAGSWERGPLRNGINSTSVTIGRQSKSLEMSAHRWLVFWMFWMFFASKLLNTL